MTREVFQTGQQILDRMASGERLRWVPCSMIGVERTPDYRVLCVGNDFLDDESAFEVGDLEDNAEIVSVEDEETGVCDYFLARAQQ